MRFTTAKKMWLAFAVVLVSLVIVSAICIKALFSVSDNYKRIIDTDMKIIEVATQLQFIQKDIGASVLKFVLLGQEQTITDLEKGVESAQNTIQTISTLISDEQLLQQFEQMKLDTALLAESNSKIVETKTKGEDFSPHVATSVALNNSVLEQIELFIETERKNSEERRAGLEAYNYQLTIIIIVISIIAVIVGLTVSYIISKGISNPIKKVTLGLQDIANGNLQVKEIHIKNNDEIGDLASSYNKMLSDLQKIVRSVRDSSHELAANAEQLSASTEESTASTQVINKMIEQQVTIGNEQENELHIAGQSMVTLKQGINSISSDNETIRLATTNVEQLVAQGSDVMSDVDQQMNMIHVTFNQTTDIMEKMARHSEEIQKVTTMITAISNQTNLLALNANIEAARAGEAGKGFAVVANEVRNLSEQSKEFTTEIVSMVNLIQEASTQAVQSISYSKSKVQEGIAYTSQSLEVFNHIEASVRDVVTKVESVTEVIEEIEQMTENMHANNMRIDQLAHEASKGAVETSAATEEQLATTEEISSNAKSLTEIAEVLQENMNHFKL